MKPSDSGLLLGLNGLNWHGQVLALLVGVMVNRAARPCAARRCRPAAASPAGLDALVLGLDPLLHAGENRAQRDQRDEGFTAPHVAVPFLTGGRGAPGLSGPKNLFGG